MDNKDYKVELVKTIVDRNYSSIVELIGNSLRLGTDESKIGNYHTNLALILNNPIFVSSALRIYLDPASHMLQTEADNLIHLPLEKIEQFSAQERLLIERANKTKTLAVTHELLYKLSRYGQQELYDQVVQLLPLHSHTHIQYFKLCVYQMKEIFNLLNDKYTHKYNRQYIQRVNNFYQEINIISERSRVSECTHIAPILQTLQLRDDKKNKI